MTKILVIGAGRSALGAAKLLLSQGQQVLVSDITEKFPDVAAEIRRSGAELLIGPQGPDLLAGIGKVVVSPGLSPDIPILVEARRLGIPILSEIDIALEAFQGTVLGVTGTNGKSTTTTLLAHLLQKLGYKAEASGNIGIAPSLLLAEGKVPSIFVLELSSYQLDFSKPIPNFCSLFMSFSPDHLERHGTMENYFCAKWKLMMATAPEGRVIMPCRILELAKTYGMPMPKASITQITVDQEVPFTGFGPTEFVHLDSKTGLLSGTGFSDAETLPAELSFHNQLNVVASIVAVRSLVSASWVQLMDAVASYQWLPFRFEKIGHCLGHPVYNDSKSTNVESTLVALRSLRTPSILLLGGHPKGESFAPIADYQDRILKLVAFGAAGPRIDSDLGMLNPIVWPTLKAALAALPALARQHPAPIVFSPACSSFDEFKNFEERGRFFNEILAPILDKP